MCRNCKTYFLLKRLIPQSDEHLVSPDDINIFSSRKVMRIEKNQSIWKLILSNVYPARQGISVSKVFIVLLFIQNLLRRIQVNSQSKVFLACRYFLPNPSTEIM